MSYISHPAIALPQTDDTVYRFRLTGWAWILLYQGLVMLLPALKLMHVSRVNSWSWLWVTLPFWGPSVLLLAVLAWEQVATWLKPVPSTSRILAPEMSFGQE